jgi:hypothetical protein
MVIPLTLLDNPSDEANYTLKLASQSSPFPYNRLSLTDPVLLADNVERGLTGKYLNCYAFDDEIAE